MGTTRRWIALAAIAACTLGAAACGGDDDNGSGSAASGGAAGSGGSGDLESTSFTLLAAPPEFDSITSAKWVDLLKEAGVDVKVKLLDFGPDTTRALVAGGGDVASNSPLPTMQYIIQSGGGDLKVIGAENLSTDYMLVTTPDITSVDQLVGKKVGISEPGDISDTLTRVVLEKAGVDPSDVEFVQIGGSSDRIAALKAGQISAGAAHAADALTAKEKMGLNVVTDYWKYIPVYSQRFIAANSGWLEKNPNLAQLVVDKLMEANQWAEENKDGYITLSKDYDKETSDKVRGEVYDIYKENSFFAPDGGLDSIDPTVATEKEQGTIKGTLPPTSEWVDSQYVDNSSGSR